MRISKSAKKHLKKEVAATTVGDVLKFRYRIEDSTLINPCMCLHIMEPQKMSETLTSHGVVAQESLKQDIGTWLPYTLSDPWDLRGINTTSVLCKDVYEKTMEPRPYRFNMIHLYMCIYITKIESVEQLSICCSQYLCGDLLRIWRAWKHQPFGDLSRKRHQPRFGWFFVCQIVKPQGPTSQNSLVRSPPSEINIFIFCVTNFCPLPESVFLCHAFLYHPSAPEKWKFILRGSSVFSLRKSGSGHSLLSTKHHWCFLTLMNLMLSWSSWTWSHHNGSYFCL